MSFINPKSKKIDVGYAAHFCATHGVNEQVTKKNVAEMVNRAQEQYLKNLLAHRLRKGVRPWELVDCTEGNDPNDIWIGVEWETGFKTLNEYRAVVQYMWQYHHNWAIDAEGIGVHFGEFTFPPVELAKWVAGKSMMDSVRRWMATKGIVTPRNYEEIEGRRDYQPAHGNATDGWGCHINISLPATRTNGNAYNMMTKVVSLLNGIMENMSASQKIRLFGRHPYGYGQARSGSGQRWWEFKLFRTPVSDEEVENIRKVSTKLALLLGEYSTNPQKYFSNHSARSSYGAYNILMPNRNELFAYLNGDADLVASQQCSVTQYGNVDPSFFPSTSK